MKGQNRKKAEKKKKAAAERTHVERVSTYSKSRAHVPSWRPKERGAPVYLSRHPEVWDEWAQIAAEREARRLRVRPRGYALG